MEKELNTKRNFISNEGTLYGREGYITKQHISGAMAGIVVMLVYRKYERIIIGRGLVRIIHSPELLSAAQKMSEHLKGR